MIHSSNARCLIDVSGSATVDTQQQPATARHRGTAGGDATAVRELVRSTLAALDVTPDISAVELCRRLSIHRRRPIELVPRRFPCSTLFGFWVKTKTADLVIYPHDLSGLQLDHSIRHETGHIVADHTGQTGPEHSEMLRVLMPTLNPDDVLTYLPRTGDYVGAEWEAETFANILTEAAWARAQPRGRGYFETGLSGPIHRI